MLQFGIHASKDPIIVFNDSNINLFLEYNYDWSLAKYTH